MISYGGKKELNGFGSKPALLLIDIYYSVLGLEARTDLRIDEALAGSTGLDGWAAVDKVPHCLRLPGRMGFPSSMSKAKIKVRTTSLKHGHRASLANRSRIR